MKIFFLIGKNFNLIETKIKEISSNFISVIYKNNFKEFILELEKNLNQKIFGEQQDIVFKNLNQLKEKEIKILIDLIKENTKIKFIFVFENEPDKFLAYLREIKIKPQVFYLQIPKGKELEKFIYQQFEKEGLKLSREFILLLKENYQENFDNLLQDLEKIKFLKNTSFNELKELFHFQTNSFKIHDAFLEKDWIYFIHSFKKFIFEDKSPGKIFALQTLTFLFNSLIKIYLIKAGEKRKISAHSFYLQKLEQKSKKLTFEEIKLLINALARSDKKLKKFVIPIEELPEDIYSNYILSQ